MQLLIICCLKRFGEIFVRYYSFKSASKNSGCRALLILNKGRQLKTPALLFKHLPISGVRLQVQALPDFSGPTLGVKPTEENRRHFTDEEIKAARDSQVSMQAGSNKASKLFTIGNFVGRDYITQTWTQIFSLKMANINVAKIYPGCGYLQTSYWLGLVRDLTQNRLHIRKNALV